MEPEKKLHPRTYAEENQGVDHFELLTYRSYRNCAAPLLPGLLAASVYNRVLSSTKVQITNNSGAKYTN